MIYEVEITIERDVEGSNSHGPIVHRLTLVRNILRIIGCNQSVMSFGIIGFTSAFYCDWTGILEIFKLYFNCAIHIIVVHQVFRNLRVFHGDYPALAECTSPNLFKLIVPMMIEYINQAMTYSKYSQDVSTQ
jgi:hypothetical protein